MRRDARGSDTSNHVWSDDDGHDDNNNNHDDDDDQDDPITMLMMMMMVVTICHMMAPEGMMMAIIYAIGVYHREGEEGGGRNKVCSDSSRSVDHPTSA